jgi:hypothetical protein
MEHIEYNILNGKKYKRLLKAYIDHVINVTGSDQLEHGLPELTDLGQAQAIELNIFQQTEQI